MIQSIKDLYNAQDLNGEFLTEPLKKYHHFFVKKIEKSEGCKKVAWIIANVVSGIFAYSILGVLAGVGLLVKLFGIPGMKKHNKSEKATIECVRVALKLPGDYSDNTMEGGTEPGWKFYEVSEFKVSKKRNIDIQCDTILDEIDSLTAQFKKVYCKSIGCINTENDEISIHLRIKEKLRPFDFKRLLGPLALFDLKKFNTKPSC